MKWVSHFSGKQFLILFPLAAIALLSGCASARVQKNQNVHASVRKVDFSATPELESWAERARKVGDEKYPQIIAFLSDGDTEMPRQFDIVFKRQLWWKKYAGIALGRTVYLSGICFTNPPFGAKSFADDPAIFDAVLVHEMAHIALGYTRLWIITAAPAYWGESMADYVRYKVNGTNGMGCLECESARPHYTSGYGCGAAFLLFVEERYGSNVIRQLDATLRRWAYTEDFFKKATGKSLDELWTEFQETPAYTAEARRVNKVYSLLGYVNGKPPSDLDARYDAHVRSLRGGPNTIEALKFLKKLSKKGPLPGFAKGERAVFLQGERGGGSFVQPKEKDPDAYPVSRTLYCFKDQTNLEFDYLVVRETAESHWKIQKAWQCGDDGKVVREFPVK
jgi:hypothetical protein